MEPRQSADGGPTSPTHSTLVVMQSKTLRVNFAPLASQPSLDFGGSPPPESHMRTLGAWGSRVGRPFARARACALRCVQAGGHVRATSPSAVFCAFVHTHNTHTQPPQTNNIHTTGKVWQRKVLQDLQDSTQCVFWSLNWEGGWCCGWCLAGRP